MNVPKLRFGEFATEERQRSTLGNLTKWSSGGTPSKENPNFWEGDIPWISASTMRGLYYSDSEVRITSEGLKNGSKLAEKGDLLLLVRGSMLFNKIPVGIAECDLAFNQDVKSLKPNPELNASYLLQWFQASEHKLLSMVVGTGIGAGKLETSDVQSIDFLLPSKKEQQKIADFLSAVDDKITFLTAQKTALTQYKQGMMQRIFSQTLRFKDDNGADYPEWDSMRLEELGEFKSGVGFPENEQGGQEGVPFFKVSDMNLSENTFHMTIANHYVTEEQIQKLKLKVIKKDAIIFAKVGAAIFLERKRIAKNFLIDNNMMAFIPKANLLFMKYLFETVQLSKFAQVGALPSYNSSDLGIIKVGLPNSYEEQTKIAQFLTELDDKINAVDAQILSAQQWKQGLLQQMFV